MRTNFGCRSPDFRKRSRRESKDATLFPWVDTLNNPTVEPTLRTTILGEALIAAGTHQSQDSLFRLDQEKKPSIDPNTSITLDEYEHANAIRAAFKDSQQELESIANGNDIVENPDDDRNISQLSCIELIRLIKPGIVALRDALEPTRPRNP